MKSFFLVNWFHYESHRASVHVGSSSYTKIRLSDVRFSAEEGGVVVRSGEEGTVLCRRGEMFYIAA